MQYVETAIGRPQLDPALTHKLVTAGGAKALADELLAAARKFGQIAEVFACRLAAGQRPSRVLLAGHDDASNRARSYQSQFWSMDPVIRKLNEQQPRGCFIATVSQNEIAYPDYRDCCFRRPGFLDKVTFVWTDEIGSTLLSFYRSGAGDVEQLQMLAALADVTLGVLGPGVSMPEHGKTPLVERLQSRLRLAFPKLTEREVQICARTLAGQSSKEIARALKISPASVMTYRQRAYSREVISSAGQLLDRLVL